MQKLIETWAVGVVRRRVWFLLLAFLIALGAASQLPKLQFDSSNESWFVDGDPQLLAFERSIELFGDSQYLVVGIEAHSGEDVFVPGTLAAIQELTDFLEAQDTVTQVRSLTNYQYVYSDDGDLVASDLLPDPLNITASDAQSARSVMKGQTLPIGVLIDNTFQNTRIAARVRYKRKDAGAQVQLMHELYEFIQQRGLYERGFNLHLAGRPPISERFESAAKRDASVVNPILVVLMVIILAVGFRSLPATFLPWVAVGASLLLLKGFQSIVGFPDSVVTNAIPPTMIMIGMGLSMHLLVSFLQQRSEGVASPDAATEAVRVVWQPALFTAITTAIGFSALAVTDLTPVREFALLGAVGSLLMFLFAMTVLPALLSFFGGFSRRTDLLVNFGAVKRVTEEIPAFTLKHTRWLLGAGVLLAAFAATTIPLIKVDTNYVNFFSADTWLVKDTNYFDDVYSGSRGLELVIDSGTAGGVKEPSFLARVETLQNRLQSLDETGRANTLVDFLKRVNRVMNDDDPSFYALPEGRELTSQYVLLYELSGASEDLEDKKDFDERVLRMSIPFKNMDASLMAEAVDDVRQQLKSEFSDLDVVITGPFMMNNVWNNYVSEGVPRSFGLSMILVGLCFMVLFRSVKYGLIALIPSVLPILVTAGLAGALGVPLDIGTMVVGAITMGIAVDDTIHVLNHYINARRDGAPVEDAIAVAMKNAGRAVMFTSFILIVGFSVMLFASFKPFLYTGAFSALIMLLALLGDLLILPALLYVLDGRRSSETSEAAPFRVGLPSGKAEHSERNL